MRAFACIAAFLAALAPFGALAQGCSHGDETAAASCAQGLVWDPVTRSCTNSLNG